MTLWRLRKIGLNNINISRARSPFYVLNYFGKAYRYFQSFPDTEMAKVIEILLHGGQGSTYPIEPCLLLAWRLLWRHNECDSVLNYRRLYCLLNRLFRRRSKKTSKLRVRHWPMCGEFTGDRWIPAQRASNAESVSIWWRHHEVPGYNQRPCYVGIFRAQHLGHLLLTWITSKHGCK